MRKISNGCLFYRHPNIILLRGGIFCLAIKNAHLSFLLSAILQFFNCGRKSRNLSLNGKWEEFLFYKFLFPWGIQTGYFMHSRALPRILAVFILEDILSFWTNLGKHSLFVSSIKTGTRRLIRLDELSSVVRRSSRTTEDSLYRWIIRVVPVFTLRRINQTNNECLPKFI